LQWWQVVNNEVKEAGTKKQVSETTIVSSIQQETKKKGGENGHQSHPHSRENVRMSRASPASYYSIGAKCRQKAGRSNTKTFHPTF
jgi:hypothetical protein